MNLFQLPTAQHYYWNCASCCCSAAAAAAAVNVWQLELCRILDYLSYLTRKLSGIFLLIKL